MKTPDEEVSERIVAALMEERVLEPASIKGLSSKIAQGKMSASDWITLFKADALQRQGNAKDKA